jgi:uncharacterized protein with von Willebrand factor type A (vWA) domain
MDSTKHLNSFPEIHQNFWDWLFPSSKTPGGLGRRRKTGKGDGQPGNNTSPYANGTLSNPDITDQDIYDAQREVRKVAKQLITKMSRSRKRSKKIETIDFRTTIRRSIQYGGVPIEIKWKIKKIKKPRIIVILDTSGSMDVYVKLLVQLAQAINLELSDFELFIFSNNLRYATDLLDRDWQKTISNLKRSGSWGGGTNLVGALSRILEDYRYKITPRTTVLLLSDLHASNITRAGELVEDIRRMAKAFYILRTPGAPNEFCRPFEGKATAIVSVKDIEGMADAIRKAVIK